MSDKNKILKNDNIFDPLEPLYEEILRKYPVKKYILKENIETELFPQAEIIFTNLKDNEDYPTVFYSYITFQQIYFHLKNFLLIKKGQKSPYKLEFVDIFKEVFLDNFLIFKEMTKYLNESFVGYMNIWLDGFFINTFRKLKNNKIKYKLRHIEPELFFLIILFCAFPKLSSTF
ncbi:MAG TPA: hypothetical protein PK771_14060, partial [Spirochaetota bacterium]|nr:hypothetical protein [Spirochaetota bacterium]